MPSNQPHCMAIAIHGQPLQAVSSHGILAGNFHPNLIPTRCDPTRIYPARTVQKRNSEREARTESHASPTVSPCHGDCRVVCHRMPWGGYIVGLCRGEHNGMPQGLQTYHAKKVSSTSVKFTTINRSRFQAVGVQPSLSPASTAWKTTGLCP